MVQSSNTDHKSFICYHMYQAPPSVFEHVEIPHFMPNGWILIMQVLMKSALIMLICDYRYSNATSM